MIRLRLRTPPAKAIEVCREALPQSQLRIKRIKVVESERLVVTTRMSFYTFGEKVTCAAKSESSNSVTDLEISSVPRLGTVRVDYGCGFTNVFRLAEAVKAKLSSDEFVSEQLIDMETGESNTSKWHD